MKLDLVMVLGALLFLVGFLLVIWRKIVSALLLLLLLAGPASAGGLRTDAILVGLGMGADTGVSEWARARGATELNALQVNRVVGYSVKSLAYVGTVFALREARRSGHPRAARVIAIGVGATFVGFALIGVTHASQP